MLVKPFSHLPAFNTDNCWTVTATNTLFGNILLFIGNVTQCESFVKSHCHLYNNLLIEF